MTQAKSVKKTSPDQYTLKFRQQALALANRIGVANKAARELGLHDSELYVLRGYCVSRVAAGMQHECKGLLLRHSACGGLSPIQFEERSLA
ncbi:hypothetical protein BIY29_11025 [Brenneria alni]|uniref:Transposase n=1 Tax=Brenneria alni TaxID=71656 RepID=A0A421DNB8_9GAMM|nr:hypothetical protein [Brenneria alni]RLM23258.1 hypothetical protein BIY29_11025 [Brenneria alni]